MDNKDYDIAATFERIEKELIESMMRNLDRHRAEEDELGINWSQWQVVQLQALEDYKKRNAKKYNTEFKNINSTIENLIKIYRKEGNTKQEQEILQAIRDGYYRKKQPGTIAGEFIKVNDRKIDSLIKATQNDFERAEVAMLRRANDQYRKIIYSAQIYAASGGTYEKAVDMATKDFLQAGINCVEYENGSRHTMKDYADMAIRTAQKRAYLTGEGEKRKEWGEPLVIMNKRGNPCPKCFPWVGLILIDDVWSGGTPDDGPYKLMSTAISKGLYHPRCKDSHSTYFPGITTVDEKTIEESERLKEDYEKEQKINYYKRQKEKCERIAEYSLDEDNKRMYQARVGNLENIIQKMANDTDKILWPSKKAKISLESYKEIMKYAKEKGIELSGFKHYDGDIEAIRQLIDDAESVASQYPEIKEGKRRLTILLDDTLNSKDFAITRGHIISINANAYRDVNLLAKEYEKLVNEGWFVEGSDYHAIIKHEIGHVIANKYKINGLEIAENITGLKKAALMEFLEKELSEYAVAFEDGREIISECFAGAYNGNNKFALKFIEECARFII